MDAFNVHLGEAGLGMTYQEDFPRTTPCCRCGAAKPVSDSLRSKGSAIGNRRESTSLVCTTTIPTAKGSGFTTRAQ
jgi:hypothetical protein